MIYHGDCRSIMPALEEASADLIIADPPYAQTTLKWDRRVEGWLAHAERILRPNGTIWIFGSLKSFLAAADELRRWQLVQDIIWEKQNGSGFDKHRFRRVHEQVAQFRKRGSKWAEVWRDPQVTFDATKRSINAISRVVPHTGAIGPHVYATEEGGPRLMRSVLQIRNMHRQGAGHPTAKPTELMRRLIAYACPPDGTVLDPFLGTGSSALAAAELGRRHIGIESDEAYIEIARRRLGESLAA